MKNIYIGFNPIDLSLNKDGQYQQKSYINNLVIDNKDNYYLFQDNTYFVLSQKLGQKIESMNIMMSLCAGIYKEYNKSQQE